MKSLLPAGVLLLSVAGIVAYAITAVTAEANLRTGTAAKTPMEAIKKSVSMIRTDRRLRDELGKRLVPASPWKLDDDPVAGQLPARAR
ncbi:hypothetical protein OKA05_25365 [Luteolibacter arcticus]|uniref:Uncharacterized protein n=1 Tax=Luteolibacter arcticus TaxID=1581411 RepID=A0ABT3GQX7_9BACT|nr:hypothetical protein [Luteolibacter arcticus]MCW1925913.1 hypothetical protein [Luteolibacter arcticus]